MDQDDFSRSVNGQDDFSGCNGTERSLSVMDQDDFQRVV